MHFFKKYSFEIIGAIFCLTLGILSGLGVEGGTSVWYLGLNKPSFNPPSWVFGPVWTILYIMIGIVLGKLWRNKSQNQGLLLIFILQFILNLSWSPLFFYFERIDLALYDLCLLWATLFTFVILARHQRTIFLLSLPYLLWVSFALLLNFSIYKLNIV